MGARRRRTPPVNRDESCPPRGQQWSPAGPTSLTLSAAGSERVAEIHVTGLQPFGKSLTFSQFTNRSSSSGWWAQYVTTS